MPRIELPSPPKDIYYQQTKKLRTRKEHAKITVECATCGHSRKISLGYSRSLAYLEGSRNCASCAMTAFIANPEASLTPMKPKNIPVSQSKDQGCGKGRNPKDKNDIPVACHRFCLHYNACVEVGTTDGLHDMLAYLDSRGELDANHSVPTRRSGRMGGS